MLFQVVGNAVKIERDIRTKHKRIIEQSTISASNKATKKVLTETVRAVSKEVGIPGKVLRGVKGKGARVKQFNYRKDTRRARTWIGLGNIPLRKVFKGKKPGGGVTKFARYVSGSLNGRTAADAFSASMPSGPSGVYVRKPGAGRLPIQEVSLDIRRVGRDAIRRAGRVHGGPTFEKERDRQLKRRFNKR